MPILASSTSSLLHIWDLSVSYDHFHSSSPYLTGNQSSFPNDTPALTFDPFSSDNSSKSISSFSWLGIDPILSVSNSTAKINLVDPSGNLVSSFENDSESIISDFVVDSSDNNGLIFSDCHNKCLRRLDFKNSSFSSKPLYSTKHPIDIVTCDPTSEFFASANSINTEICIYNRLTNVKSNLISLQKEKITALELNSSRNFILLSGSSLGSLQLFDSTYSKSAPLRILPQVHLSPITKIKFPSLSPKSAYSVALDGYICLSDTKIKKSTCITLKSSSPLTALELGPGHDLYTGDIFGNICMYDSRSLKSQIWLKDTQQNTKISFLSYYHPEYHFSTSDAYPSSKSISPRISTSNSKSTLDRKSGAFLNSTYSQLRVLNSPDLSPRMASLLNSLDQSAKSSTIKSRSKTLNNNTSAFSPSRINSSDITRLNIPDSPKSKPTSLSNQSTPGSISFKKIHLSAQKSDDSPQISIDPISDKHTLDKPNHESSFNYNRLLNFLTPQKSSPDGSQNNISDDASLDPSMDSSPTHSHNPKTYDFSPNKTNSFIAHLFSSPSNSNLKRKISNLQPEPDFTQQGVKVKKVNFVNNTNKRISFTSNTGKKNYKSPFSSTEKAPMKNNQRLSDSKLTSFDQDKNGISETPFKYVRPPANSNDLSTSKYIPKSRLSQGRNSRKFKSIKDNLDNFPLSNDLKTKRYSDGLVSIPGKNISHESDKTIATPIVLNTIKNDEIESDSSKTQKRSISEKVGTSINLKTFDSLTKKSITSLLEKFESPTTNPAPIQPHQLEISRIKNSKLPSSQEPLTNVLDLKSSPVKSPNQPATDFSGKFIQSIIEDSLLSFKDEIKTDLENIHLDMIKQNFNLQTQISQLSHAVAEKDQLISRILKLEKENKRLREYDPFRKLH
ncbi:Protein NEDD1 [Smittium mucronatum]|uniref:Protein NEDD1 n=1 Tax=Smittium mucronatum TaxID=133383 RepID=A0A1R0H7S2_9FUNG|nr:Protein NEDD1 [Smittium mucronatum]